MNKAPLIFVCVAVSLPATAQYKVEVLHGPGFPFPRSFGWGAGDGQQVGSTSLFGTGHALLWSGSAESFVDLHPAGWDASTALGASGGKQIGWRARHGTDARAFATMWSGSAESWVDLHTAKYLQTYALGIGGDMQVGTGFYKLVENHYHALLWSGTPESAVSLNPEGAEKSLAYATDGKQQVGIAGGLGDRRAALWSGTAESYVNLHPKGYIISEAYGAGEGIQAGYASSGNAHAVLWRGSAQSVVDLNPGPNEDWGSRAFATNGEIQVGLASNNGPTLAALWGGTPESYLNLHQFLPEQFQGSGESSEARGIDSAGNIVGWAADTTTGRAKAVLWVPVPEPSSWLAIGLGLAIWIAGKGKQLK